MAYAKQTWNNGAAGGTPRSAARLNYQEDGIEAAHALYDEGFGAIQQAVVTTSETSTSATFTDLATSGPAISNVVVGSSGKLKVTVSARISNSGANATLMGFTLSGAGSYTSPDSEAALTTGTQSTTATQVVLLTALTPGTYTVTAKYRTSAGTGTWQWRRIITEPV